MNAGWGRAAVLTRSVEAIRPGWPELGMGDARIYPDGVISSAMRWLDRVWLRRILAGIGRRHRLLTCTRSRPQAVDGADKATRRGHAARAPSADAEQPRRRCRAAGAGQRLCAHRPGVASGSRSEAVREGKNPASRGRVIWCDPVKRGGRAWGLDVRSFTGTGRDASDRGRLIRLIWRNFAAGVAASDIRRASGPAPGTPQQRSHPRA